MSKKENTHGRIVEQIAMALKPIFPSVQIYPFGSRLTGLGGVNSDLDLFIDLNFHYFSTPFTLMPNVIRGIEEALKLTKCWTDFLPILAARTPILRAFNIPEKVDCDLSFSNGLSHCNTKLINYLIETQPLFGKVTVIIKYFAQEADFKMNSYIIILMVVFYFQIEKLLPSVCLLQQNVEPRMIGAWQSNFNKTPWPHKSNDFRKYLIGFFEFYARFDFKNNVICPFVGQAIRKECFTYGREQLPIEFHLYMKYSRSLDLARADPLVHLFAYEKDMVIQDPLELIHNVAKGVRKTSLDRFVSYCRLTAELLKSKKVL